MGWEDFLYEREKRRNRYMVDQVGPNEAARAAVLGEAPPEYEPMPENLFPAGQEVPEPDPYPGPPAQRPEMSPRVSANRIRPQSQGGVVRDRNGKVVVSSGRISPMNEAQQAFERERQADAIRQRQISHAQAAVQRDPLIRQRFQAKMGLAKSAPAYGAEYGADAAAAADFTGKQLYGPDYNANPGGPTMQDIQSGQMAREREDWASGQFQKRMAVESDMADEVGGPGGGLDFLDAPTPMADAGQPDIAQQQQGPQVGPMRPNRANIPTRTQMATAKAMQAKRREAFQKKREGLENARQFKLARQLAQRARMEDEASNRPDPVDAARYQMARRLAGSRDPKDRATAASLLSQIKKPGQGVEVARIRQETSQQAQGAIGQRQQGRQEHERGMQQARFDHSERLQTIGNDARSRRQKFDAALRINLRSADAVGRELAEERKYREGLLEEKRKNPRAGFFSKGYGTESANSLDEEIKRAQERIGRLERTNTILSKRKKVQK